jgi:hypothetical protein
VSVGFCNFCLFIYSNLSGNEQQVIKFYTYSVIKQRKYSILLEGVGVNMIVESTVLLAVNNSAEYTFRVTRVTKRKIIDVGNHLYKSTLSPV